MERFCDITLYQYVAVAAMQFNLTFQMIPLVVFFPCKCSLVANFCMYYICLYAYVAVLTLHCVVFRKTTAHKTVSGNLIQL